MQVFAPTFPGYGRSEKPAMAYSQVSPCSSCSHLPASLVRAACTRRSVCCMDMERWQFLSCNPAQARAVCQLRVMIISSTVVTMNGRRSGGTSCATLWWRSCDGRWSRWATQLEATSAPAWRATTQRLSRVRLCCVKLCLDARWYSGKGLTAALRCLGSARASVYKAGAVQH